MTPPLACCLLAAALAAAAGSAEARAQQAEPAGSSSSRGAPRQPTSLRIFAVDGRSASVEAATTTGEATRQEQTVRVARPSDAAAGAKEPLRLPPRGTQQPRDTKGPAPTSLAGSLTSMIGGLAIVLGLFLFAAWFVRRTQPKSAAALPGEVVELLGRAPLSGRQQMHLVRFGGKLLLVSVTPTGAETLSEITDPIEVDRLAGVCQQNRPGSITKTFRQVLHQLGGEPVSAGFVGGATQPQAELANNARGSRPNAALGRSRTQN